MHPDLADAVAGSLRIAVVVPSYRRPALLQSCLTALSAQSMPADEIIVVYRAHDVATLAVLTGWPAVTSVEVDRPGVVAAMYAGASSTVSEIVAFTDDDATPRPTWLGSLHRHFGNADVGAVGGRDVVDRPTQSGPLTDRVGLVGWWGRVVGNHHLGGGPPRDVAVLKGVNMAFRRSALSLPLGLRGDGAQVDFELACCLSAAADGWRLVYDPSVVVDHTVGPRFDTDRRYRPDAAAVSDAAYNRLAILLSLRTGLGVRRAAFGLFVGEHAAPGLLRTMVAVVRGERDVSRRLLPALSGQLAAVADAARRRPVQMLAVGDHAIGPGPVDGSSESSAR